MIAASFIITFLWLAILTVVSFAHNLCLNWIKEALTLLGEKVFGKRIL